LSNCKGRAVTTLKNGIHYLKSSSGHDIHAPQASRPQVIKAVAEIKKRARETREAPTQIIQDNMINIARDVRPHMPSLNALRQAITRVRKTGLPQPQSASDINIPASLCNTLKGDLFLIKDHKVEQDRLLIFTTSENVRRLSRSLFWIMDGTFSTVPLVFYQLYTIHAPIGKVTYSNYYTP
jgi:hypothetical protein